MSNAPSFWRDDERALADAFVRDGYVIIPAESRADLDRQGAELIGTTSVGAGHGRRLA